MRPFNRDVVEKVKERRACDTAPRKKETVDRVEGPERIELYSKYCDNFNSRLETSWAEIGNEKCKQLLSHIANANNKVSRLDSDKKNDAFAVGIEKQRKITKPEMDVCGPDVPAEMDSGLKKKDLVRKYDRHINAEMEKRRIKYPKGKDGKSKLSRS